MYLVFFIFDLLDGKNYGIRLFKSIVDVFKVISGELVVEEFECCFFLIYLVSIKV